MKQIPNRIMKKIFNLLRAFFSLRFQSAPLGNSIVNLVWPFAAADTQTPAYAATLAVSINNQLTILEPATLTGAMTINLTLDAGLKAGAIILLKHTSDGTARTTTFGTGFSAPAQVGVISKTFTQSFMYDGSAFLPMGAALQIN
jgi:hypothetical protein